MNQAVATSAAPALRSPSELRRRTDRLLDRRDALQRRSIELDRQFRQLNAYLELAPQVSQALEQLNEQLFQKLLGTVQEKLTVAVQEILEQPLVVKAEAEFKRGSATVEFSIERDGHSEDILRGQGGSVANVLSVGLRMFALATLDENQHRRFLVLDEQDCWLRPDLVPRLVKIVHEAGRALGFQVLMISHHDVALFERYADRIYQFIPEGEKGVAVRLVSDEPVVIDQQTL
jgi:ABC-type glutathione transport system ATPase component